MSRDALDTLLVHCKVTDGAGFRLAGHPTQAEVRGLDKAAGEAMSRDEVQRLSGLQERLYADGRWAVLLVFQALDAAGKDGTIKHVLSGVNPLGVTVTAFKPPSVAEAAHDFLWRVSQALPPRGTVGVFNRSHYEEVIVPRVHPDVLARQHLPAGRAADPDFWTQRLAAIAAFEQHLAREGTLIVKFFLHVSREEQRKRLLARLRDPGKLWKFDAGDVDERRFWTENLAASEAAIAATARPHAPWYVIPADRKWLMRLLVARAAAAAIGGLDLAVPVPTPDQAARFAQAEATLVAEP